MVVEQIRLTRTHWAVFVILLVAVATRSATFGNPLVDMDDQFYWLVGRSWWDGHWPIVDIWDRKPVGLFLIYGAIWLWFVIDGIVMLAGRPVDGQGLPLRP